MLFFDGENVSNVARVTITMETVNDHAPVLDLAPFAPVFTEGNFTAHVLHGVNITDTDVGLGENIQMAIVSVLPGSPDAATESLDVDNTTLASVGLSRSFDNGTLYLTGNASVSAYETLLETVTYRNSAEEPTPGLRQIKFVVHDANFASNAQIVNLTVHVINDQTPVLDLEGTRTSASNHSTVFVEEGDPVAIAGHNATIIDLDSDVSPLAL